MESIRYGPYRHTNTRIFAQMFITQTKYLQEAIVGIAYPVKKKDEENDEGENKNLMQSLRKLIMGKFDDKKNEFYEWSQAIHDEVLKIMNK